MALSGTLTDFALDDVLRFIGATRKSGRLTVDHAGRQGSLWLDGGKVAGAHLGEAEEPVEVIFDLLRLQDGSFEFETGAIPPAGATTKERAAEVAKVLDAAHAMLAEWRQIEKIVPSVKSLVALGSSPPAGEIRVEPAQWATICAVGAGGPVSAVAERLGLREFAACKAVKALVDAGLAGVAASSESRAKVG